MAMLEPEEARAWFERAVEENYRLLYSVAFNILRCPQAAEDATQEAVLRAFSQSLTLENLQSVTAWLTRITQNVSRDMRKKHAPVALSSLDDPALVLDQPAPYRDTGLMELDERHGKVRSELAKLPSDQAAVIALRYMEELSVDEIALRLGRKPNAIAALLHRSRSKLKKALYRGRTTKMVRSKQMA